MRTVIITFVLSLIALVFIVTQPTQVSFLGVEVLKISYKQGNQDTKIVVRHIHHKGLIDVCHYKSYDLCAHSKLLK